MKKKLDAIRKKSKEKFNIKCQEIKEKLEEEQRKLVSQRVAEEENKINNKLKLQYANAMKDAGNTFDKKYKEKYDEQQENLEKERTKLSQLKILNEEKVRKFQKKKEGCYARN